MEEERERGAADSLATSRRGQSARPRPRTQQKVGSARRRASTPRRSKGAGGSTGETA